MDERKAWASLTLSAKASLEGSLPSMGTSILEYIENLLAFQDHGIRR
jgi:hypothetical protein